MKVIAEVGLNHGGNYDKACDMIEKSLAAGADEVKLQHFKSFDLHLRRSIVKRVKGELSVIDILVDPLSGYLLEQTEILDLFYEFKEKLFFSVFCPHSFFELFNISPELPRKVCWERLGDSDLVAAFQALECKGEKYISVNPDVPFNTDIIDINASFLLTVPKYPAQVSDYITLIKERKYSGVLLHRFRGISDHSLGLEVPRMAKRAGASVYECHVCYSHDDGGVDSKAAKTFEELAIICEEAK